MGGVGRAKLARLDQESEKPGNKKQQKEGTREWPTLH
jgi:hypothetical protein